MTTTLRPRRKTPFLLAAAAVLSAVAGAVLGVWVDWTSPNPVYGAQVILLIGTALIALVGVLLIGRGIVGRILAVSSVGLLIGSVAGLVLSPPAINVYDGTMTLRGDEPEPSVISGRAMCEHNWLRDELYVMGELGKAPPDGPAPLSVYFGTGFELDDPAMRDDGLMLTISLDGGDAPALSEAGAESDSVIEYTRDGASGTVRFADLRQHGERGGVPVEGTVEWTCESE
jgi:hypothetical protein